MNPQAIQMLAGATIGLSLGPALIYVFKPELFPFMAAVGGLMWFRTIVLIGVKVGWRTHG